MKVKLLCLSVLISLTLSACVDDGEDGANGNNGMDGVDGAQGPQGETGAPAPTSLSPKLIGRFTADLSDPAGAAEIVQYHSPSQRVFAINSAASDPSVEIIDIADLTSDSDASSADNLTSTPFILPASIDIGGVTRVLDGANSIAIHDDLLAVAMQADSQAENGVVVFYDISDTTPSLINAVEVGNLPDMVGFTPDGSKVLVANEGEPNDDYSNDPEGSVAVIAVTQGVPADTATLITFSQFNGQQTELAARGIRFSNPVGSTVAQDLEPEYITASNDIAFVSLQENNALAKIDLSDNSVTLHPLGSKDWGEYLIDVSNRDGVSFNRYPGLYGLYMPDTIASFTWKGATFVVSANEGDAREYISDADSEAQCLARGDFIFDDGECIYLDEVRVDDVNFDPSASFAINYDSDVLGRLKVTTTEGDTDNDGVFESLYAFGARSFSIWDANGLQVYDSGDDFGRISASIHGSAFNNNDDENEGDSRSDDKGAEPEALALGNINNRTYAFIGLERMGSILAYDISNPYQVRFIDYFYHRDLTEGLSGTDIQGDLAPEGMVFVSADQSPTGQALLVVGNEVSGSVSIWQFKPE